MDTMDMIIDSIKRTYKSDLYRAMKDMTVEKMINPPHEIRLPLTAEAWLLYENADMPRITMGVDIVKERFYGRKIYSTEKLEPKDIPMVVELMLDQIKYEMTEAVLDFLEETINKRNK